MDYSNIPLGFKITTQIPLDSKASINSESLLKDLGFNNNLAFTYFDGMVVTCQLEKTDWQWREVIGDEQGLLTNNFTYPNGIISNGITYSLKSYNFFESKSLSKKVDKVLNKSLVLDSEITKLSHLNDTTDLQKPTSTAQQASINAAVQAQLIDSTLINGVTTSSAIPPTGNIHAIGVGAGTYTNWGGMVVPANNIGTLSRVGSVYSVYVTAFADINKILPWSDNAYPIGSQRNYLGVDYYLPTTDALLGDIPGISSKWVERLISNIRVAFCLYEITIDSQGYATAYNNITKAIVEEMYITEYKDIQVTIDSNGYASDGWDWYMRPLVFNSIPKIEPLPNKIRDTFSSPVDIVKGSFHYGFPGVSVGLTGILHSVYRKGAYHTGTDGTLMYSYSKDYGETWSDEVVFMQGGTLVSGAYQDFRDTKCLRMTNGKYIVNGFIGYATNIGGTPPNDISYDMDRYECYSIVVTEKADGTFDLATLDYNIIPKSVVNGYSIVAGGGLVQRGETLYYTVYSVGTGNPFNSFLIKSEDYGQTFTLVGTIGVNSNENSIAFIGDTMYSVLRGVTVGTSWLSKSEDFGVTWIVIKTFPTHWHGMFLHSMVDTIMIAGRSLAGAVRIMFIDKFGRSMLGDFYFSINGDSGYSQICTFENYVYLVYHTEFQVSPRINGIQIQKIERNKLIGLSN